MFRKHSAPRRMNAQAVVRSKAGPGPSACARKRSPAPRVCACGAGNHAYVRDGDCSAGRCACPCSRLTFSCHLVCSQAASMGPWSRPGPIGYRLAWLLITSARWTRPLATGRHKPGYASRAPQPDAPWKSSSILRASTGPRHAASPRSLPHRPSCGRARVLLRSFFSAHPIRYPVAFQQDEHARGALPLTRLWGGGGRHRAPYLSAQLWITMWTPGG